MGKIDARAIVQAQNRRFKRPIVILGYEVRLSKVVGPNEEPKMAQNFVPRSIETMKDLAALDYEVATHRFLPVPTMATQVLTIMLEELGLIEDRNPPKPKEGENSE